MFDDVIKHVESPKNYSLIARVYTLISDCMGGKLTKSVMFKKNLAREFMYLRWQLKIILKPLNYLLSQ